MDKLDESVVESRQALINERADEAAKRIEFAQTMAAATLSNLTYWIDGNGQAMAEIPTNNPAIRNTIKNALHELGFQMNDYNAGKDEVFAKDWSDPNKAVSVKEGLQPGNQHPVLCFTDKGVRVLIAHEVHTPSLDKMAQTLGVKNHAAAVRR